MAVALAVQRKGNTTGGHYQQTLIRRGGHRSTELRKATLGNGGREGGADSGFACSHLRCTEIELVASEGAEGRAPFCCRACKRGTAIIKLLERKKSFKRRVGFRL